MTNAAKQCAKCRQTFPATTEFFHRHQAGKFGVHQECKKCRNATKRALHSTPNYQKTVKAYRANNRDAICAYNRSRPPMSEAEREEGRRRASLWYYANKDRACLSCKRWRNTPEGRAASKVYQYRYLKRRLQHDGEFALRRRMRTEILSALRQGRAQRRRGRWWEVALGYTLEELRQHLEKQFTPEMSWENRGKVWEIDHVRPLAGFVVPDTQCPAFREAWGLSNLQPLLKAENRAKGGPRRP